MNAIKSILSIVCILATMSLHAQEQTTVKPATSKNKMTKVKINKAPQTLNNSQTKVEKKEEVKKEEVKKDEVKKDVKPVSSTEKKDATDGKTKMKSINRPVKVNKGK